MKFNTAVEARKQCDKLLNKLNDSNYNPDLLKLYNNISDMVTRLSIIEVEERRARVPVRSLEQKQKIIEAADYLEKLIIISKLMR